MQRAWDCGAARCLCYLGQSKPRLIFSRINGPNVLEKNKQKIVFILKSKLIQFQKQLPKLIYIQVKKSKYLNVLARQWVNRALRRFPRYINVQCRFIFFSTLVGFSRQSIQYIYISAFVCFCFTLFCFCCCFFLLISYRSTNRVKISTNPRIQACLVLFSFIFFLFQSNSAFFLFKKIVFNDHRSGSWRWIRFEIACVNII